MLAKCPASHYDLLAVSMILLSDSSLSVSSPSNSSVFGTFYNPATMGTSTPVSKGMRGMSFLCLQNHGGAVWWHLTSRKNTRGMGWTAWTTCLHRRKQLVVNWGQVHTQICGFGWYLWFMGIVIGVFAAFFHAHLKSFLHMGSSHYCAWVSNNKSNFL